jgi:enterochelin esterase-like enzyme
MKILRKQMIFLLAMSLLLPCPPMMRGQTPTPGAKPGSPPVIDESVPPAFDKYMLGPDSLPHPSVPAGKTFKFDLTNSRIFPNTSRTITVYVPAAYSSDKPACVYVGLDGLGYNVSTVFDNLIAQHAMPVTIAIGLAPGSVNSTSPPDNPRFDRSFEFDSLNGRLARFLIQEVIPEVEQRRTPDGAVIKLSNNPDDRAIGGGSTGGIGAFTVAWERPDAFRRLFISIGTFVGMRGGEGYYVQVRKTEPKPLRIFMQDGAHDEWGGGPES